MALLLIILIVLSLVFDFLNGFHDSANIVATIVSSRAMSARAALILATIAEFFQNGQSFQPLLDKGNTPFAIPRSFQAFPIIFVQQMLDKYTF